MKKIAKTLFLLMTVGLMTGMYSCSDDVTADFDIDSYCSQDGCANNPALKELCIERYNSCLALDQGSSEECQLIAFDTCTL
jgi:hypothetical protein